MDVYMKISMPGFEDTESNREALRIEIELRLSEWAWKYGISAEVADDPGKQYNRGYDRGFNGGMYACEAGHGEGCYEGQA